MYVYPAHLVRVVDGDTLDLRVDLGFNVRLDLRVRLWGVDTPEKYGVRKGTPEHQRGEAASAFTAQWLGEAHRLEVRSHNGRKLGRGRYGRWIAEVWRYVGEERDPTPLSGALLSAGHARPVRY